jgi:hypothetical protein
MTLKTQIIAVLVCLGLGYAVGRYLQPAQVETREVIKEVEKIKRDVVIIERKVTKPDGTVVEEKTTTDKSKIETAKSSDKSRKESRRNDWLVGAGVEAQLSNLNPVYRLEIQRRILGPVLVGASARTDGYVGAIISLEL